MSIDSPQVCLGLASETSPWKLAVSEFSHDLEYGVKVLPVPLVLLVRAIVAAEGFRTYENLRRALEKAAEEAKAPERRGEGSLEVCSEGRRTRRPIARHMLDLQENVHRYELRKPVQSDDEPPLEFHEERTAAQDRLLRLLEIEPAKYGR